MVRYEDIDDLPILYDFHFTLPRELVFTANKISQGMFEQRSAARCNLRGAFIHSKLSIQELTDQFLSTVSYEPVAEPVGEVFCVGGLSSLTYDPANFIPGVEKFVTDRFVKAGLLPDDNARYIPSITICPMPFKQRDEYEFRQVFYRL